MDATRSVVNGLVVHEVPGDGLVLLWHHGSPQTGAVLPPVLEAAAARGLGMISIARPVDRPARSLFRRRIRVLRS